MDEGLKQFVTECIHGCGDDRTRLMDIVRVVQAHYGAVSSEATDRIAEGLGIPRIEVEGLVSFYSFYSSEPKAPVVFRFSTCPSCRGKEWKAVEAALERELGCAFGQTTGDGAITLERTPCIGLCDQGPAALVNEVPVVGLVPSRVPEVVATLRRRGEPWDLAPVAAAAHCAVDRALSVVATNVRKAGPFILTSMEPGAALHKAVLLTPEALIGEIKAARLSGRGGAGFPVGLKWEFARGAAGGPKYVICNADEGEPGTFKDRVILTENPDLIFEGMAIAGYAMGAEEGILYLRGEYAFLVPALESVIAQRRAAGLLGRDIAQKKGFNFDVRIQLGAGAYICGEESALIESAQGLRGVPRNRPPFPVQQGFLDKPTSVNNVESFCAAARVLELGAAAFAAMGYNRSTGTKLLSVSGDCARPGVYEVPFGITLREFLASCGGENAVAVQVGGPSGTLVGPPDFGRRIAYEDLATGGSMMVFGPGTDLLAVVSDFMAFFIHESCGWCAPCRVGNGLIKERLDRIRAGEGTPEDIPYLDELCDTVKKMSRCGLGQTSPNPVATSLKAFRPLYEALVKPSVDGKNPNFHLADALKDATIAQGREPVFHD